MNPSFLPDLAQRIHNVREDADRTQQETASALGLNVRTYGRYERGESEPQASFLRDFCSLFGVSSDALLGLSAMPESDFLSARFRRDPLDDLTDEQKREVLEYAEIIRLRDEKRKRDAMSSHSRA